MSFLAPLAFGYTAEQVLDFVVNSFPHLGRRIKQAKNIGHDAKEIINSLNGLDKKRLKELDKKSKHSEGYHINPLVATQQRTLETSAQEQLKKAGKTALQVGGTALGAYGAAKAAPYVGQAINKIFPKGTPPPSGAPFNPTPSPAPMSNAPMGLGQTVQPPTAPPTQPIVPPPQSQEGGVGAIIRPPSMNPPSSSSALPPDQQRQAMMDKLSALTPEFKQFAMEKYDEGSTQSLDELFKEFHKERAKNRGKRAEKIEAPIAEEAQVEEPKKIEKAAFVATPSGVTGTVESVKEKEALVKDEEGKLHKVSSDEIIESPLPEREIADVHDELIQRIEKETGQPVSRNVFWAGYNPLTNKLLYIPHDGSAYVYGDISDEDRNLLTNLTVQRKTTGENHIGAWEEGTTSPIGAAMSALIKRLQSERGGKGSEYEDKFGQAYSAFAPAIKASKKKYQEKQKSLRPPKNKKPRK